MSNVIVWRDGGRPLCRRKIAPLRPLGLAARVPVVLALLEPGYRAFLRVRPRVKRLALRLRPG